MCPFPWSSFESGGWLDGTYCCDTPGRQPDHRFHQSGCDREDLSGRQGSRDSTSDRQNECPEARSSGSRGGLLRSCLALYMQSSYREVLRCLLEGIQWLDPSVKVKVAGKSGISQARTRLGWEPLRQLHDEVVRPIAAQTTRGAWYRCWRLVSIDGSTLDVADDPANDEAFGRPGSSRGSSAFPQIRFVSLVENGTHVLFGTQMAGCRTSEIALAKSVLPSLQPGMLCLADRNFFGFGLWNDARRTGADLLWRVKAGSRLVRDEELPDGSYLSHIYPSEKDRRHKTNGVKVRVIDYCLA